MNGTNGAIPRWDDLIGTHDDPKADGDVDRLPLIVSAGKLREMNATLPEPIIDSLLRRGEVGNFVAPPKSYKSHLVKQVAVSVAAGKKFLGRNPTTAGKVLLVDNELFASAIGYRLPRVAAALGCEWDEVKEAIDILSVRGQQMDINRLGRVIRTIKPGTYNLIILDALYKFFPKGFDENSNANMTELYGTLDRYAAMADAGLIVVHHTSKGSQAGKSVTDVGAGAGAQSRAPDLHAVLRQHEEDGCVVLEAAVRSFPPPAPLCLRWQYPIWVHADDLDPTQLRVERNRGGRPRKDHAEVPDQTKTEPWTPERFAKAFVAADPVDKTVIAAMATTAGLSNREAQSLLALAEHKKLIHKHPGENHKKVFFANRPPTVFDVKQHKSSRRTRRVSLHARTP